MAWPAIIGAAGALGVGALNLFGQKKQAAESRQLAQEEFQRNKQLFLENRRYSSPQNQMKRFKKAGLNPNLIYGQGTPGNVQNTPQYQAPPAEIATVNPAGAVLSGLDAYQNIRATSAQADNIKQQEAVAQTQETINQQKEILLGLEVPGQKLEALKATIIKNQAAGYDDPLITPYGSATTDYQDTVMSEELNSMQMPEKQRIFQELKNKYQQTVNYWAERGMAPGDQIQWRALLKLTEYLGMPTDWLKIKKIKNQ